MPCRVAAPAEKSIDLSSQVIKQRLPLGSKASYKVWTGTGDRVPFRLVFVRLAGVDDRPGTKERLMFSLG